MVEIFCVQDRVPTDEEILSFWEMIFSPEQVLWEYEESTELAQKSDAEVLLMYRKNVQLRTNTIAYWAKADGLIVGMASLNIFTDESKSHCAELGFGVRSAYQQRGIGYRLVNVVIARARQAGLRRIECSSFADNVASRSLLRKTGFTEEGLRTGAVLKDGQLRGIRLYGLLL